MRWQQPTRSPENLGTPTAGSTQVVQGARPSVSPAKVDQSGDPPAGLSHLPVAGCGLCSSLFYNTWSLLIPLFTESVHLCSLSVDFAFSPCSGIPVPQQSGFNWEKLFFSGLTKAFTI